MLHRFSGINALALVSLLFLLASGSSLSAGVLYSQPWDGSGGAYSSQNDTKTGGYGNFATIYDNFTLASAASISKVDWVGEYFNPPTPGTITKFTLGIYADAAGQPGGLLGSWGVSGNAGETSLGTANGFPIFQYSLTLPSSVAAAAGTQYWLAIVADLGFPPQWGWTSGTGGDGLYYQDYFTVRSAGTGDMAFSLESGVVPEPFTFPLVGIGLAALAVWRRRR